MKKRVLCMLLLGAFTMQLFGCASVDPSVSPSAPAVPVAGKTANLMAQLRPAVVNGKQADAAFSIASGEFALSLLRNVYTAENNVVLSPYSVLTALAMAANGAKDETLSQMERAFGMTKDELNAYLAYLTQNAGQEPVGANSIWLRSSFDEISESFLQANMDWLDADAFTAAFDEQTLTDMNQWIKDNCGIENALQSMDPNAVLYLINALTFQAQWATPYKESSIKDGIFHVADGSAQTVSMMSSKEDSYVENDLLTGFLKPYAGDRYAFAALLPKEGVTMDTLLSSLSGEALTELLQNPQRSSVMTTMPKLSTQTSLELTDCLRAMGITDAFDTDKANFYGITDSDNDCYLSRILHSTELTVDGMGTTAGAVTIAEMVTRSLHISPKSVCLDRPYVMAIYDTETNTILFLGAINQVTQ